MSDFDDLLRRHRTDPLCARVGRYLDQWSRETTGAGYEENECGWQWQAVDATNVVSAGPDVDAIEATLRDSGFIPDDCALMPDDRRRLTDLAELVR